MTSYQISVKKKTNKLLEQAAGLADMVKGSHGSDRAGALIKKVNEILDEAGLIKGGLEYGKII